MIKNGDDGGDIIKEYLRNIPVIQDLGIDRVSELMERCRVSKRGARIMIDHDQEEF